MSFRVLLWLANTEVKMRVNDIRACSVAVDADLDFDPRLAARVSIEHRGPDDAADTWINATAFLPASLRDEAAAVRLATRSPMIMAVGELWAEADSIDELLNTVQSLCERDATRRSELDAMAGSTFRFDCQSSNAKQTRDEHVQILKRLGAFFPLTRTATVSMKSAQHRFHVISEYDMPSSFDQRGRFRRCFFVRHLIGDERGPVLERYSLKTRRYIGTTSMDVEMSLLTANQALCLPGSLVIDPFVGTGSLLVAAAHFGAYCVGTDIDPRVLHGKGGVSIATNFADYGFPQRLLGVMAVDLPKSALRQVPMWDAIITDPPYGVRAGARTVGMKAKAAANPNYSIPAGMDHFPQMLPYSLHDSLRDLLAFAARTLVLGGRLVYWLPTTSGFKESDFPLHPCLELLCWGRQLMSGDARRLLVTMRKVVEYDAAVHANPDAALLGQLGNPVHLTFFESYYGGEDKRGEKKGENE